MFHMKQLGLIPDWQYDPDPANNYKINPFVKIPSDWPHGQRTVQPQNYFAAKASGDPLSGLGVPAIQAVPRPVGVAGLGITMARWAQPPAGLGFVDYDSWAWKNKKWLVIGGVGLIGLGLLSAAGFLLK